MGHYVDLLIAVASLGPLALRAKEIGLLQEFASHHFLSNRAWWACLFGVTLNYIMHGCIWNCPKYFTKLCGSVPLRLLGAHPVDVFASLEVVAKLVQGGALCLFLGRDGLGVAWEALSTAPVWCWIWLAVGVSAGQVLNVATYTAIGNAGVYYGFKLGHTVPWCYGFPFNTGLRHPQYLGVVLTLWGALPVLLCRGLVEVGFAQLVLVWGSMYAVMSAMEQLGDSDKTE